MKLSDLIKNYRKNHKLSVRDFADLCGLSRSYVSVLENDTIPENTGKRVIPSLAIIQKLAKGMNMDPQRLMGLVAYAENDDFITVDDEDITRAYDFFIARNIDTEVPPISELSNFELVELYKKMASDELAAASPAHAPQIPVLGIVPCGEPIEAIEDIIEWIDVVPSQATGHFGLIAKGDSMAPYILDGDILIVKHGPVVASGKIAIVKVNGDDATCKRLIINDAGITLMPYNPTFQPMIFSPQDVEDKPVIIIGEVVEIRRRFNQI
jgi:repressor LexA